MLKNYIKIAWRNLKRNRAYSLINTIGLSVGIASCLLIFLFIQDELSYDRFHEKAGRTYRVVMSSNFGGTAQIPAGAVHALSEFSEVKTAVRLYRSEEIVLTREQDAIREEHFFYTDSSFFDVFSFPLIKGDPSGALSEPNTIVLTRKTAQKYFGDANPIGRTLTLRNGQVFQVTGVTEDVPHNSHIQFAFLASFGTLGEPKGMDYQGFAYLLLDNPEALVPLESKLAKLTEGGTDEISQKLGFTFQNIGFELQPVADVHLFPALDGAIQAQSDVRYLYVFGAVGVFILLIACINYMNLATASSTRRVQEAGIRKALGANQRQIARQFLTESVLFTGLAFLLALAIAQILLPVFSGFMDRPIHFFDVQSWCFWGISIVFVIVIGFLSGSYPVFILSRFTPFSVLKRKRSITGNKPRLRQGLVVFQFTVSIILITGTVVIQNQLSFIQNKRLGYEAEHVLTLPMVESFEKRLAAGQLKPNMQRISTIKQELADVPGVQSVSVAYGTPNAYLTSEIEYQGQKYNPVKLPVDHDYVQTMGMELIAGRDFSREYATDSARAIIVNETAARTFDLEEKVGEPINMGFGHPDPILIGIVKDFHTASLHHSVSSTILAIQPAYYNAYILRLESGSLPGVLSQLKQAWENLTPNYPFDYQFLDNQLQARYETEQRIGKIFIAFSALAIIIACLGLYGLTAFSAERRTKEVGIRKVLGATVNNIVSLLSKDFLKLVLLGLVIAAPIAWYAMNRWLQSFAYRIEIGPGIFLLAGGVALLIALTTVSWQSIRAALVNPVESLRSE